MGEDQVPRTGLGGELAGATPRHVHAAHGVAALDEGRLGQEEVHSLSHVAHGLADVRVPGEGQADLTGGVLLTGALDPVTIGLHGMKRLEG